MNDKTILDRYGARGQSPDVLPDADPVEDLGAFGWLRGIRDSARMLELRKKDGSILAVGYGWLERVEFNPSEGITLSLVGRTIRITGLNLNAEVRPCVRLFEGITRHRVPWVQEAGEPDRMESGAGTTIVERIDWAS
jgi:hypothetical protein